MWFATGQNSVKPLKLADLVMDIVFDVGKVSLRDGTLAARETRLRDELQHDPMNALAAANLGAIVAPG